MRASIIEVSQIGVQKMVDRNLDDPSGVGMWSPDTPGTLKRYLRPEVRRYGRVSRVIFGERGGKPEGLKKAPKGNEPDSDSALTSVVQKAEISRQFGQNTVHPCPFRRPCRGENADQDQRKRQRQRQVWRQRQIQRRR
jgi:hypothetical protein